MAAADALVGSSLEGVIRSFKHPWGWIAGADIDGDIFAHKDDLKSGTMKEGAKVKFVLGVDEKTGKPRALEMAVGGMAKPGTVAPSSVAPKKKGGEKKRLSDEVLEGTIAKWVDNWGWISCPGASDQNIFGHSDDVIAGGVFFGGEIVTFTLGVDNKGRERALDIQLVSGGAKTKGGKGGGKGGGGRSGGRVQGQVKSWKDHWGWIYSSSVDGDVFAHKEDMADGMPPPAVGASVSFVLGSDDQGRRRAKQIRTGPGGARKNGANAPMVMRGTAGPKGRQAVASFQPAASAEAFLGLRLEGEFTKWKSPWGWISCVRFQQNLFAHEEDLVRGTPAVGSPASFLVGMDENGRLRALEIQCKGPGQGQKRKAPLSAAAAPVFAAGNKKAKTNTGKKSTTDFSALEGVALDGKVKSWKDKWGWISSDHYSGGDLFAHQEDLTDGDALVQGQQVTFIVGKDDQGRWRAREIAPFDPAFE
eukprot:TRINITY_DN108608_c1_g1_i1.p1 TRINITY_DN108608_c1_g1~~TRINITY_DN108608_c1_g1_i1.p1  ORF type:complete len:489 (+),score=118.62 TRINITY_DN108608_c1_g1_i1:45-1469(+)